MDLVLDASGALAWSRGPTTAPIISVAARRLAVEPTPTVGSASPAARDEGRGEEALSEGGQSDPLGLPGPADHDWQIDPAAWATTQFSTARIHDGRRTARLVKLATQIAGDPSSALPRSTETWGDLKAAYRLLGRPEVTFQAVATPHYDGARPGRRGAVLDRG